MRFMLEISSIRTQRWNYDIFCKYNIQNVKLFTKEKKAFAFVELASDQEVVAAVKEFNNFEIEGRKLLVRLSRPQPCKTSGPSSRGDSCTRQSSESNDHQDSRELQPPLEPLYDNYDDMPPLEPIPSNNYYDGTTRQDRGPLYKIALSNFPNGTSKEEICTIFQRFSPVMCNIINHYRCGPEFLYFLTSAQAIDAVEALHFRDFRGQILEVKYVGRQPDI